MSTRTSRWWRLLAVLLAFTLVAAACGGDDDDEGGSASASEPAEESSASASEPADESSGSASEPAEEMDEDMDEEMDEDMDDMSGAIISDDCPIHDPADGTTIDLMGWEFPVTAEYANEFEDCNEGSNLTVNVQLLASDAAQDQITLDLGTGSPEFEIVHVTNSTVGTHAENLVDLAPFIEMYRDEFGLDDIPAAMWEAGTVDGRVLGVPIISNTMHFFYNQRILDENGVTPPTTFAEVIEACGVLSAAGFDDPFNMNFSAGWSNELEFSSIIKSLGGDILNDDNTPAFNSPEGLAAVEQMLAVRDACTSNAGRTFSIDDSEAALRAGELPMASIWASRAAAMDDEEVSLVVGEIAFAPSLFTEAGSLRNGTAFVDLYAIPAGTSVDPEIIFQVLMAATDLESQNAAAAHAAVSRLSASNDAGPRNNGALATSVAEGVGARSKSPALPLAQGPLGEELLEVLQNDADPATALANAEERYIEEATAAGFI
ncbi:MAG: extracellular solute-binding protein [Actinomycetota bacterium]